MAIKSLLTSGSILPFKFIPSRLYFGGFSNFSAQSTGQYKEDVDRGQFGYGGLIGYKTSQINIEASARNLNFDAAANVNGTVVASSNESLVYSLGIRKEIFSWLNVKAGWALHEIKSFADKEVSPDIIETAWANKDDNGYFYGVGINIRFMDKVDMYIDGTYYFLKSFGARVVDSELGFKYYFN